MSVYCDWVTWKVWSSASISVWQHVKIVWADPSLRYTSLLPGVKQPTNNCDTFFRDWERQQVWPSTSASVWQHVRLHEQFRPRDTSSCRWDIKQHRITTDSPKVNENSTLDTQVTVEEEEEEEEESHSKALFEIFYNLLTAPRTVSNTYAQVARAQSCANHVQHIERLSRASVMLRATWYEGTAQLLSLTKLKSHLFELYFIGWIIKPMKEGRKPEYPEKTPGDELKKMPHTKARRFKPQARLEPAQ